MKPLVVIFISLAFSIEGFHERMRTSAPDFLPDLIVTVKQAAFIPTTLNPAMQADASAPVTGHLWPKITLGLAIVLSLVSGVVLFKKKENDHTHLVPLILLTLTLICTIAAIITLYQSGQGDHPIPPPVRANFLNLNTHHFYELIGSILTLIFSFAGIIWLWANGDGPAHSDIGPMTLSFVCALQLFTTFLILL